jgi:hypothetical protein
MEVTEVEGKDHVSVDEVAFHLAPRLIESVKPKSPQERTRQQEDAERALSDGRKNTLNVGPCDQPQLVLDRNPFDYRLVRSSIRTEVRDEAIKRPPHACAWDASHNMQEVCHSSLPSHGLPPPT